MKPSGSEVFFMAKLLITHPIFKKDFNNLFMRDTEREREAETQAEREAGFMQGAQCGT